MDPKDCGGYGNQVLYRMCREQPHHTDIDVISGKIWLIGRAYTVPIERRAGAFGRKARTARMDLHKFIAPKIASSPLDEWLASVADVRMVSFDNLRSVLLVHFRFVQLLKKLAGLERRSFASKYLHFHQPSAFFIYDSRARRRIRQKVKLRKPSVPVDCTKYDGEYADFVLRCIRYRDEKAANRGEPPMGPRKLDQELLGY